MSTATLTKASATRDAAASTAASTAARHASATLALEALSAILASSSEAGRAVVIRAYGSLTDSDDVQRATLTAVKMAKTVAAVVAGGKKPRGEAGQNINAILAALEGIDTLTDTVLVTAARTRLDELAADKRARTERKKALAETMNDHAATPAARHAALEVLTGMDEADSAVKSAAIVARLNAAMMAARVDGLSEADMADLVTAAYAVKL